MKKEAVILIGFMGCGKSTIGRKLAGMLGCPFLDTDALIEEYCGKQIPAIFAEDGEAAFRQAETEVLCRLKEEAGKCVIATGGGMPLKEENVRYLREIGTVFFLEAEIETLLERLKNDTGRPLASGEDREQRLRRLYAERLPVYKAAAEVCIYTEGKGFSDILQELEQYIGNNTGTRNAEG